MCCLHNSCSGLCAPFLPPFFLSSCFVLLLVARRWVQRLRGRTVTHRGLEPWHSLGDVLSPFLSQDTKAPHVYGEFVLQTDTFYFTWALSLHPKGITVANAELPPLIKRNSCICQSHGCLDPYFNGVNMGCVCVCFNRTSHAVCSTQQAPHGCGCSKDQNTSCAETCRNILAWLVSLAVS